MDLVPVSDESLVIGCADMRVVVTHDPGVIVRLASRPVVPPTCQLVVHGYGGTDRARKFLRDVGNADRWRPFVRQFGARLVVSGGLCVARLPFGNVPPADIDRVIEGWPDLDAVLLSDDFFALAVAAVAHCG